MTRFILAMLVALFSSNLFAQIAPTSQQEFRCDGRSDFHPTVAAVIAQALASYGGAYREPAEVLPGNGCYFTRVTTGQLLRTGNASQRTVNVCPANSTLGVGNQCFCNSPYVQEGSSCELPSVCDVGQGRTFNRTQGWARSPNADADDLVVDYGPGDLLNANDGTCVGPIQSIDRCYRSQVPTAQGLYRVSCDFTMVMTGDAPPGSTVPETDPTTANATCPGFVGEVNGKTVCVGTSSSPLPAPIAAPNQPTAPGNPSAGVKPSTGEGAGSDGPGRTPSVGIGGNSGGPASSAVGAGGTGDRDTDGQDPAGAVCGASPLPPCAVRVDETGTPAEGTAEGRFSQANTDLGKVQTDAQGAFGDIEDITLPSWTFTFAFPTGCTPLVLPAFDDFEIDVCQFQPIIHDLMSVIWVIAGIWGLIALFRNASGV